MLKHNRFIVTGLTAAAVILAAACRSSSTTSRTTTTSSVTTEPGISSTMSNNTGTTASSSSAYGTTATTSGDNNGTTVVDANGTSVTKTTTTTTIYRDGRVVTTDANGTPMTSSTSLTDTSGSTTTTPVTVPAGAAVVVTTTTTTKNTPAVASASASVSGSNGSNQQPMTSSTQTYGTTSSTIFGHRRRYPNFDILAFADRASFSNNNRSLNGTINTGALGTSIRNENGWGVGFNAFFGSNFSTEFTASRIRPTATFTPSNTAFNPITGLRLRMTPITGAFQIHLAPHGSIDPYIGGGATYVSFHADRGFNAGTSGLTGVSFRDEWGPMVNAGLRFGNARGISFNVDGKYSWVRARAETTFDNTTVGNVGNNRRIGVNPLILSAGIRFGF